VENLKDPVTRAKALANHYELRKDDDLSWVLVVRADNRPDAIGKRVSQIAKERGCEPIEAVFDIIVDSNNHASACYFSMQESDVEMAICHPRAMICTDSSVAKSSTYHPRLRAAFPRAIGRYARDKQLVPLPEIIRRVTSLPAHVYSLEGKGRLQEGYDADICIFSAETLIDRATYTDCTAGCEGLSYVLVSGEVVVKDAVHNGKRCGKVLQKHRS
jgi:N-acyl-D-amino-acid deacylase